MRNGEGTPEGLRPPRTDKDLPRPTVRFRRRAWLEFQRALDPLARPKPVRIRPQR